MQFYSIYIIQKQDMSQDQLITIDNLKRKIFFICNYNKNSHLNNTYALIFYIFYQIIPLNFILQYLSEQPNQSNSFFILTNLNKMSLLIASLPTDNNQQIYLAFTLIIILFFGVATFCAYTLQVQRKAQLRKQTLNKLWIIQQVNFVLLVFRVPIGVLSLNYFVMLINLQQWYLLPLPFLTFTSLLTTIYILEEFSNENNYNKIVSLSQMHVKYQGAGTVLQLCIKTTIIVILQRNCTPTLLFMSTIVLLIMDIIELDLLTGKVNFLDDFTSILIQTKLVLSLIIEINSIIIIATQSQLFLDNIFISILSTTILAFLGLHQYQKYQKQQLLLSDLNTLSNQEDTAKVMIEYLKFLEATNVNKVFLLALVQVHKSICQNEACICKTTQNLSHSHSDWTSFFYKFVLITLAYLSEKYPRSLKITMIYLNFKLHFIHSFSMTHLYLNRFLKQYGNQLSWSDEFAIYQMANGVQERTDELNQSAMRVNLDIIFKEEVLEKDLRKLIQNINTNNFKKYSMIQQQFCKLNTVETLCHAITEDIRSIEALWNSFKTSNSFNMKLYAIFLVYNQSIIMSKSTFSDVKTEMITKLQALRGLRGVSARNLCKYIHNKNACIIESQCIKQQIGIITNISAQCEQVFQLRKDKMKGSNIHNIMANFMATPHQKMVREWMQTEKLSSSLKDITNTYFVDNNNNCFQGSESLLTFYVIIIKKNDDGFIILNHDEVIQGFGRRLQTQQMLNTQSLKTKFNKFCQTNCMLELQSKQTLKTKILMRDAQQGIKTLRHIHNQHPPSTKKENNDNEIYYYDCSAIISKQHLGTYLYYSIKFIEINKIVRRRTISWMNHNSHFPKSKPVLDLKRRGPTKQGLEEIQITNIISSSQAIIKHDTNVKDEEQIIAENMSVSSCFTGGQINIKLNKIFLISKEKVIHPNTIQDQRSPITTLIIIILSIILICAVFAVCKIFNAGFSTYQSFLAANVAVSNSNNLMQIVYNNIMTAGIYCNTTNPIYHQQRCAFLLYSGLTISSESYNMIVDDLRHYLTYIPSLTTLHYYQVFQMPTNFTLNSQNIASTMRQFMEQFHYLLQQTALELNQQINNQQFTSTHKLTLLLNNWQSLRKINQNAIDFYKQAGINQINLITRYMVIVIGFIYLMMILLILAWRSFKLYIEEKKQKIARVHGIISSAQCEQLKKAVIIKQNEELFQEPTRVIKPLGKPSYLTKNQFIYHKDKSFRYFLLPFFILLTALNLPILINLAQLLPDCQKLMQTVSDLMNSQKQVLQNYQQVKNNYFFGNNYKTIKQINNLLVEIKQNNQPKMNKIAKNIIKIMLVADPNFSNNINYLFNYNVCKFINKASVFQYQDQHCGKDNYSGVLEQGLLSTTTHIHRQTYSILLQFTQSLTLNSSYINEQFNTTIYDHIDDQQIYFSRVYKLIHEQIMSSLQMLINQTYSTLTLYSVLEVVVLGVGLAIWLANIHKEKEVLSNLYGEVLQFPQTLLQDNRLHIKTIEDNLKFDL